MKAMILAAGLGTRMRPLTEHTPKPLLAAGGKPLIVWHIERLRDAGIVDIVINTAWLGEKLEAALGDGAAFGVRLAYSREGEPLETAGGIRRALPLLGDAPFLVVNGDIWTDIDFTALSLADDELAALVLVDNPEHNPQGDFHLASDGKVRDNSSPNDGKSLRHSSRLTFSGVGLYRPALFSVDSDVADQAGSELESSLEDKAGNQVEEKLGRLLRNEMPTGKVSGIYHPGHWWDIGTPQRLHELDVFLSEH